MRPYDPEKDKGKQLYELITREGPEGVIEFDVEKMDVEEELAAKTPWYYVVEAE